MAIIVNPTPPTTAIFDKMWITSVTLQLPVATPTNSAMPPIAPTIINAGRFLATLLPYDGKHVLSVGGKTVLFPSLAAKQASDVIFAGIITNLVAECKRQAKVNTDIASIDVYALNPTLAVRADIRFIDTTSYNISDCYKLAGIDAIFATVFQTTLLEIARQAGLAIA